MTSAKLRSGLMAVLSTLPDHGGGISIVLATSSVPPALALLSTGDVLIRGDEVRVGIHATSSTVDRLGGGFTLLVPLGAMAVRVEVVDAVARRQGSLAMITGTISAVRPTSEPPWRLRMTFEPGTGDGSSIEAHLAYWRAVKAWLEGIEAEPPPVPGS